MVASLRETLLAAAVLSTLGLVSVVDAVCAQTKPKRMEIDGEPPHRAMWVGNSFMYYNDSMHNYVGGFIRASDQRIPYRGTSVTISGSGIDWHDMESYFRKGGLIRYNISGDNELRFNDFDKLFHAVIISDCSQCPIHPELRSVFHEYAKRQIDIIRRHGAVPILLMTWAYKDKPEMTAQLVPSGTCALGDVPGGTCPGGPAPDRHARRTDRASPGSDRPGSRPR